MYPYTMVVKDGKSMHYTALMYFFFMMIIGYVILMALFVGILLRNFEDDIKEQNAKKKKELDRSRIEQESLVSIEGEGSRLSRACDSVYRFIKAMFAGKDLSGFKYREISDSSKSAAPKSGEGGGGNEV